MSASSPAAPDVSEQEIFLRAYTTRAFASEGDEDQSPKKETQPRPRAGPSEVSLIFDVETTTDASQRMRFLVYQLRIGQQLDEQCIVVDPEALSTREMETIRRYCRTNDLPPPMTLAEFRSEVLIRKAFDLGATIVLFNAPFDLSRIATDAGPAHATKWRRKMQDGFSFRIAESDAETRIQVKALNPRAGLLEFTARRKQATSRSRRKRGQNTPTNRGHIVDVRTLAGALLSGSFSLGRLTTALNTSTKKADSDDHGAPITPRYLDYARDDVQATWECYLALKAKYDAYGLDQPLQNILSEASIGKAVLQAMKVGAWRQMQPDADPRLIGLIMGSYFGGRAEIHIRKQICRVLFTDFMSMYPTVTVLQGLWRFVIAKGFVHSDSTEATREFVDRAEAGDFQKPAGWRSLVTLVQIKPSCDLLPVRANYDGSLHSAIGLNFLTAPGAVWITLADCLAAKFQTGKCPEIVSAITFEPGELQTGLQSVSLFGEHEIDPYEDDLYREVIRLRVGVKAKLSGAAVQEKARLEELAQAYKITANAGYGVFAQFNVGREDTWVVVHGLGDDPFRKRVHKVEEPGPYFHPLLATLITAAARLMLTLAQVRVREAGLDWAFCDTDSLAIAMPDRMSDGEFLGRAKGVVDWFTPLNPYGFERSILQMEDENFSLEQSCQHQPLYCWAVSAKRYALFNMDPNGRPVMRKASAHGLGHLAAPYADDDGPSGFPEPVAALKAGKNRVPRWQHDGWYAIVSSALAGKPHAAKFDYHPKLSLPAVSRYSVTSPLIWRWFDKYNEGKPYSQQVKPFGFLYGLHPRKSAARSTLPAGSKVRLPEMHPITTFEKDVAKAVLHAFDRETGEPILADAMQTYAEALAAYPNHPESKFLNGQPFDTGPTRPRHVVATDVVFIGKESERWEEGLFLGINVHEELKLGPRPLHGGQLYQEIREAGRVHPHSAVAKETGLPRSSVSKICAGQFVQTKIPAAKIRSGLLRLGKAAARRASEQAARRVELQRVVSEEGGIRAAARKLGIDHANLAKLLSAGRSEYGRVET